jgi:lysozyme
MHPKGLKLLQEFEGCELEPYFDTAGIATIGWGSIWRLDGSRVEITDAPITQETADELLRREVAKTENAVRKRVKNCPEISLSAFVSLAYNIGLGAFNGSTALKRHNRGEFEGAAEALQWFNKAGGNVSNGLIRRRKAEAHLYLEGLIYAD